MQKEFDVEYINELSLPKFIQFTNSFDSLIRYIDLIMKKDTFQGLDRITKYLHKENDHLSNLIFENRKSNFYFEMYSKKIDEYLSSENYLIVNKAVKLIGALKLKRYYPHLLELFSNSQGYIRRNILIGIQKADQWENYFLQLIEGGLNDKYFEVRREAVKLYRIFLVEVNDMEKNRINKYIDKLFKRKFSSFEVKVEIIKLLVLIKNEDEFYSLTSNYTASRNNLLKQAVIDAIAVGIVKERLMNKDKLFKFMNNIIVTNSAFRTDFYVRKKYSEVINCNYSGTFFI